MSVLDFKEIPEAHKTTGKQDEFELFAREFFKFLGFKIIREPGRGADDGADIIIEDELQGKFEETKLRYRWLVSCKHKAHSGKAVSKSEENQILDSVRSNSCDGFIGFYSTLPSSSLVRKMEGLNIETQIFNKSTIEKNLFAREEGKKIIARYFPKSFKKWVNESGIEKYSTGTSIKKLVKKCLEDIDYTNVLDEDIDEISRDELPELTKVILEVYQKSQEKDNLSESSKENFYTVIKELTIRLGPDESESDWFFFNEVSRDFINSPFTQLLPLFSCRFDKLSKKYKKKLENRLVRQWLKTQSKFDHYYYENDMADATDPIWKYLSKEAKKQLIPLFIEFLISSRDKKFPQMQLAVKAIKDESINLKPILKASLKKHADSYSSNPKRLVRSKKDILYSVQKFKRLEKYTTISIQQLSKHI